MKSSISSMKKPPESSTEAAFSCFYLPEPNINIGETGFLNQTSAMMQKRSQKPGFLDRRTQASVGAIEEQAHHYDHTQTGDRCHNP